MPSGQLQTDTLHVEFEGHRVAYRVSGHGPALVVLSLYRRRADMVHAQILSSHWQVYQIAPLGYGYSDRVAGHAGESLARQILAVLDRHGVERFVVWGYSAGGAMTLCIARDTPRVAGMVCGGFVPHALPAGVMRGLDRRLRPDHPSRSLWWWFNRFDWIQELSALSCARLFYWGSDDRQMAKPMRRVRDELRPQGVDFLEFPALDHGACSSTQALERTVVPAVAKWMSEKRLSES